MDWHRRISPTTFNVWPTRRVDSGCARRRQRISSCHESVVQSSVVALFQSRLRIYGTLFHWAWCHRRVWLFSSLAWTQCCYAMQRYRLSSIHFAHLLRDFINDITCPWSLFNLSHVNCWLTSIHYYHYYYYYYYYIITLLIPQTVKNNNRINDLVCTVHSQ